jgi:hypothetical protein
MLNALRKESGISFRNICAKIVINTSKKNIDIETILRKQKDVFRILLKKVAALVLSLVILTFQNPVFSVN